MKIFHTIFIIGILFGSFERSAHAAQAELASSNVPLETKNLIVQTVQTVLNIQGPMATDYLKVGGKWAFFEGNVLSQENGFPERTENSLKILLKKNEENETWEPIAQIFSFEEYGSENALPNFIVVVKKKINHDKLARQLLPNYFFR